MLVSPGECSFADPAVAAETGAVGCLASCDYGSDPAGAECVAVCFRVVAAVGEQQTRPASWPSDGAADRRDRLNEREQLRDVMCVGAREQAGERCAVGVGD